MKAGLLSYPTDENPRFQLDVLSGPGGNVEICRRSILPERPIVFVRAPIFSRVLTVLFVGMIATLSGLPAAAQSYLAERSNPLYGCGQIQRRPFGVTFDWRMKSLVGVDDNGNGLPDMNTRLVQDAAAGKPIPVILSAFALSAGAAGTEYRWSIERISGGDQQADQRNLAISREPEITVWLNEGVYEVTLIEKEPGGFCTQSFNEVIVNNILIVSMGDSYSSGEGNPEIRRCTGPNSDDPRCPDYSQNPFARETWGDDALQNCPFVTWPRFGNPPPIGLGANEWTGLLFPEMLARPNCDHWTVHRSSISWPYMVARVLEQSDPYTSVALLALAQTGASADHVGGLLHDRVWQRGNIGWAGLLFQDQGGPFRESGSAYVSPESLRWPPASGQGGHRIPFYDPIVEVALPWLSNAVVQRGDIAASFADGQIFMGHAQIPKASRLTRIAAGQENAGDLKLIDHVLLSHSGNDLGFGEIIREGLAARDWFKFRDYLLESMRWRGLDLRRNQEKVANQFRTNLKIFATHDGPNVLRSNVYLIEYPDALRDENGRFVSQADDIADTLLIPRVIGGRFAELIDEHFTKKLNAENFRWANENRWTYVGGIYNAFRTHGYPASDAERWIRTATESRFFQEDSVGSKGTYHPNYSGHIAIADKVLEVLHRDKPEGRGGGPYAVDEGALTTIEALEAYPDDPSLEKDVVYEWDPDGDHKYHHNDPGKRDTTFDSRRILGPTTVQVALRARHKDLLHFADSSVPVFVRETPLNLSPTVPSTATEGESFVVNVTLGQLVTFNGRFISRFEVNWGEGTTETIDARWAKGQSVFDANGAPSGFQYSLEHEFGSGGSSRVVEVVAFDNMGVRYELGQMDVVVADVPPQISAGASQFGTVGLPYVLPPLSDPDGEFQAVSINWGDGVVDSVSGVLGPWSHVYATEGNYNIEVSYQGQSSGVATPFQVSVGAGLVTGRLFYDSAYYPRHIGLPEAVYSDSNRNGVLDVGERSTTVQYDDFGNYVFHLDGLPAGRHLIRVVDLCFGLDDSCVVQTVPGSDQGIEVEVAPGTVSAPLDFSFANLYGGSFGAYLDSYWKGVVFEDLDGDGSRSADEPGIPGIRVRKLASGDEFISNPRGEFWFADSSIFNSDRWASPDLSGEPGWQPNFGIGGVEAAFPSGPPGSIDFLEKFWHQSESGFGPASCGAHNYMAVSPPPGSSRPGIACALVTSNGGPYSPITESALSRFGDPQTRVALFQRNPDTPSGFILWSEPASIARGTVITFDWNFLTNETDDRPNDFAIAVLGGEPFELANSRDAKFPGIPPTSIEVPGKFYSRQTGWRRGVLIAPTDIYARLSFAVFNEGADTFGESTLLIDNVEFHGSAVGVVTTDLYPGFGDIALRRTSPVSGIPSASDFVASDGDYPDRVHLSWAPQAGASGYRVYRRRASSVDDAELLAEVSSGSSYDDTTAVYNVGYEYFLETRYRALNSDLNAIDEGFAGNPSPPQLHVRVRGIPASAELGSPIDLGRAIVGDAEREMVFSVRNAGRQVLNVLNLQLPGGVVLVENLTGVLQPDAEDSFSVRMTTSAAGEVSGFIEIASNDPSGIRRVPVTGSVRELTSPTVRVSGNGFVLGPETPLWQAGTDFDGADLGGAGVARSYLVGNSGETVLTLGAVSVPAGFSILTPLPQTLLPGESAELSLHLDASSSGHFAGDVVFATNDPARPEVRFSIRGRVTVAGDANLDGEVSSEDFDIWMAGFGSWGRFSEGDFNGDGHISLADYTVWVDNFGATAPAASSTALTLATSSNAGAPTRDENANGILGGTDGSILMSIASSLEAVVGKVNSGSRSPDWKAKGRRLRDESKSKTTGKVQTRKAKRLKQSVPPPVKEVLRPIRRSGDRKEGDETSVSNDQRASLRRR